MLQATPRDDVDVHLAAHQHGEQLSHAVFVQVDVVERKGDTHLGRFTRPEVTFRIEDLGEVPGEEGVGLVFQPDVWVANGLPDGNRFRGIGKVFALNMVGRDDVLGRINVR